MKRELIGKTLYGAAFAVALPVLLIAWAAATAEHVPAATALPPALGLAAAAAGLLLMLTGAAALRIHGHGLPMNAFPPPHYVSRGIYRYLAHPIYVGFSALGVGAAIAAESGSGLWLVSPVVMLGCAALVVGYERHDLRARFGAAIAPPSIRLATDEETAPSVSERVSCYLLVLLPWVAIYEAIRSLGVPQDAMVAYWPFEARLPVLASAEPLYASVYGVAALVPLLARTRRDLRRFELRGLLAMAVVFPLFLALPLIAPPRPFVPRGVLGGWLRWERALDTPAGAFPSFHVIWAILAAEALAARAPRWRWAWRAWALAVAASCVATGMHAIADVLAGIAAAGFVVRARFAWETARRLTERVANSWRERRWGALRVINHGLYGGLAAFAAVFISGELAGPGHQAAILASALTGLVTAALWAQFIEGSPQLLRPYGYFGGLLGVILGAAALARPLGTDPWLVLAGYSAAGPAMQSLGRLRCLVQGCCHGRPAPASIGIRYEHPLSRVCRLTGWKGVPLHPTPLYSILWNGFVALVMFRLWSVAAPLSLISGLYLVLMGLGRFAEEAYRGEPQTPVMAGLRLYQWMALGAVLCGILVTFAASAPAPAVEASWTPLGWALGFGALAAAALGVDFPASQRRFSRLA